MSGVARHGRWTAALLGLALSLSGCADPELAPPDEPSAAPTAPGASQPDPRAQELVDALTDLRATLTAAHTALTESTTAADLATARAGAERAVHALTAHPGWEGDLDGDGEVRTLAVEPLLPGPRDAIPEDAFYGDQFARTLTAARNAGGALGGRVVDALRDPIVGDLGVWQADAAAIFALVDRAADRATLDEVEASLPDIPGHATRALTYALVATRSEQLELSTAAAERALAHLDLTLAALEDLAPTT